MALTGIQIFKLLPKTNCGDCKFPTCLAFAMKLAAKQVALDACPHVSDEARAQLDEASAPPIRGIRFGTGDDAFKVGEESVLFRHEKTFYHMPGFAVIIEDSASDDEVQKKIAQVNDSEIERVGQHLKVDFVAVRSTSDAARFKAVVEQISSGSKAKLILLSEQPDNLRAALEVAAGKRPLIGTAAAATAEAFAALAKEFKVPLAISAADLEQLSALSETVKDAGIEDIVLVPQFKNAAQMLADLTQIRRAAIQKGFKPLGYPVMLLPDQIFEDELGETMIAAVGISKYASLILLNNIEKEKMMPLFTLRQNIYTDPQKPMQVKQDIYAIGEPNADSPVFITTNFSLTFFLVQGEVEASKVPAWLMVQDCEGLSVLTAWAAGKFTPGKIAEYVAESGIAEKVNHRNLVIPGYVSVISGSLGDKLSDWKIIVGPRDANQIPKLLKAGVA